MNATPEPTHDGRAVITREPAYILTAFGKKVENPKPAKGINQLLLDDGAVLFECAERDYTHDDVQFVVRHRTKHGRSSRKYPAETLAKIMEYWHAERAVSVRGVNERTAIRLNADKISTTTGGKWYASTVAAVAQAHKSEYPAPADPGEHIPLPFTDPDPDPDPIEQVIQAMPPNAAAAGLVAEQVKGLVEWLVTAVVSAESRCDHDDYDVLKAKAEWADRMQSLLAERK